MDDNKVVKPIEKMMNKKMNRKHFLFAVGVGAFAATGITDITKNLINFSGFPVRSEGYGSTSYGTKKEGE